MPAQKPTTPGKVRHVESLLKRGWTMKHACEAADISVNTAKHYIEKPPPVPFKPQQRQLDTDAISRRLKPLRFDYSKCA
jgi:hypothetical protein